MQSINGVMSKRDGNNNNEIHFLFPVYNTRYPLKSLEILESGKCKDLSIKWQLKYGKPFILNRQTTLKKVFPYFTLINNKGYVVNYRWSKYMAYCIMQYKWFAILTHYCDTIVIPKQCNFVFRFFFFC